MHTRTSVGLCAVMMNRVRVTSRNLGFVWLLWSKYFYLPSVPSPSPWTLLLYFASVVTIWLRICVGLAPSEKAIQKHERTEFLHHVCSMSFPCVVSNISLGSGKWHGFSHFSKYQGVFTTACRGAAHPSSWSSYISPTTTARVRNPSRDYQGLMQPQSLGSASPIHGRSRLMATIRQPAIQDLFHNPINSYFLHDLRQLTFPNCDITLKHRSPK